MATRLRETSEESGEKDELGREGWSALPDESARRPGWSPALVLRSTGNVAGGHGAIDVPTTGGWDRAFRVVDVGVVPLVRLGLHALKGPHRRRSSGWPSHGATCFF